MQPASYILYLYLLSLVSFSIPWLVRIFELAPTCWEFRESASERAKRERDQIWEEEKKDGRSLKMHREREGTKKEGKEGQGLERITFVNETGEVFSKSAASCLHAR